LLFSLLSSVLAQQSVTPNGHVLLGDCDRLDGYSGNTSLILVLLAFKVGVVADFNGLQDLTRPGSEEVGEHHIHRLGGLHARRNFCEPELQDLVVVLVFIDSALDLHLLSFICG